MTSAAQSLFGEKFVPNCTVCVTGEHFFTDRVFYTNPYGLSFFDSPEQYGDNPFIAPQYADKPGLFEEMAGDVVPPQNVSIPPAEREAAVMRQINPRFIVNAAKDGAEKQKSIKKISCRFDGNLSVQGQSVILQYGTVIPCLLCITDDCVSADFPFSPFSEVTFQRDRSVMQTLYYPYPNPDYLIPPEEVAIDFLVTTKKLVNTLRPNAPGVLQINYTLTVGATRCESVKLQFEVTPKNDADMA